MQPRESQPDVPCKAKLICIFCTCIFLATPYLYYRDIQSSLLPFILATTASAILRWLMTEREPSSSGARGNLAGAAAAFGVTTPTSRPPLISSNRVNQKSMQERDLSCAEKVDRHHLDLVLHLVVAVVVAAAGPGCHTQPHSCSR